MKALSKDLKVIVAALETSSELVVSGHRVRRKEPLAFVDETEVLLRTAIVDNLPDQATIGMVFCQACLYAVSPVSLLQQWHVHCAVSLHSASLACLAIWSQPVKSSQSKKLTVVNRVVDSLTEKFSAAGKVKMVRICQPNSGPRSIAQSIPGADLAVSRQAHALVEFETQGEVAAAVKQLTDSNNWYVLFPRQTQQVHDGIHCYWIMTMHS